MSLKDASGDEEGESDRRGRLFPSGPYPLASRLVYHLRCLREDATNSTISAVERLTLVRDREATYSGYSAGTEARKIDVEAKPVGCLVVG